MEYDIDPHGAAIVADDTAAQVAELKGVLDMTDQAVGEAGSALEHSPASSTAAMKCLEYFVRYEVESCYARAENTISCTGEACMRYFEGDSQMASQSQQAESNTAKPDIPGFAGGSSRF